MPENTVSPELLAAVTERHLAEEERARSYSQKKEQIASSVTLTVEKLNKTSQDVTASQIQTMEQFSACVASINASYAGLARKIKEVGPEESEGE